jgi:ribosome recycling factor
MANYDFKALDTKISAAKDWLGKEYRGLRTGRASPAILDSVSVAAYGSTVPLKQVANVVTEDARTLRIAPFDPSVLKDIERAIVAANLGVGTATDSSGIRVTFPELTGERRQEFVKLAKTKLEEARTTVRLVREEAWKDIQAREQEGTLTEDDKFMLKDELQKKVDKVNEELEAAFEKKEQEMTS